MREKVQKFWYEISQQKLTVLSAAKILGVSYFVSNALGALRTAFIGNIYGQNRSTDMFLASFRLPDLIYNLLILGAISAAFIPVFTDYLAKEDKEESNKVASNFLNFALIAISITALIIFVLARKLVPIIVPGFFSAPGEMSATALFSDTVWATRVLLISTIFFTLSGVSSGILNSYKRFLTVALAPIVYNISIILGILFLSKNVNPPVFGAVYGAVIGSFLHFAIQVPELVMTKFKWRPILHVRNYSLPKIIKMMVPRALAIGVGQINLTVDMVIASFFAGGITALYFADNIQTLPTVVFGIAIATAVFPWLAEAISKNDRVGFLKSFSESARKILYFMIPAAIGIITLRAQIVRLIFGLGNLSWESTYWTAKALGFFAIGLVAQGLIPLCLRGFYALKDTKTPLLISLFVMVVNVLFSVTLPFISFLELGVAGIALAFSIAGFVNVSLLLYFLHNKIGALDRDNKIFASSARLLFSALIMGVLAHYSLYVFDFFLDTHTVLGIFVQTLGAVAVGALTYLGLTRLFVSDEVGMVFKKSV